MRSPSYRKVGRYWGVRAILGLVSVWLLGGCTDESEPAEPKEAPFSWSVLEKGPYNIGFRSVEVVYDSPIEQGRAILLNVWYPTLATEGDPVAYMEGLHPDLEALGNALAAAPVYSGGYPVHVYSHGDRGWGGTSSFLMRSFASHGWVVIAPDHTDNTILTSSDPRPTSVYVHRPSDIRASLDALAEIDATDPLAKADTSRVVMSGHSFGCYSTWASAGANYDSESLNTHCLNLPSGSCSDDERAAFLSGELSDPRVVSGITLAGAISRGFFGADGHLGVQGPMMLMSGTEDGNSVPDSWETLAGIQRSWVELEGGCHQSFALGVCDTLEPDEAFHIVSSYALAFARLTLLGDDSAQISTILDGSYEVSLLASITSDDP